MGKGGNPQSAGVKEPVGLGIKPSLAISMLI